MIKAEMMREHLGDVLSIEQHILQSVQRHVRDDRTRKFQTASELLQRIELVLGSHIGELERRLSATDGGVESKLKKAATRIVGSAVDIFGKLRTSRPVTRNLRDDCVSLNFAAISYGMLSTAALALNETDVAMMAQSHLTGLTALIVELSEMIPFVLTGELADEGKIEEPAAAIQAAALYRKAWSHEVTTVF